MRDSDGEIEFPIWLIGDSNPLQWQEYLDTPLDSRHPIRHNIWTSVLDVIQDRVYRAAHLRVETQKIYIRNAVTDPTIKPKMGDPQWHSELQERVNQFGILLNDYRPTLVFCFGAFAFEFVRRATGEAHEYPYGHWNARALGNAFRERITHFDSTSRNIIPLLHRVVSGGKFRESQHYYLDIPLDIKSVNYFDTVGQGIADLLLQHREELNVWIE